MIFKKGVTEGIYIRKCISNLGLVKISFRIIYSSYIYEDYICTFGLISLHFKSVVRTSVLK